jgi:hypothetical protein
LKEAEILIIVGYGCKDSEVNKMITENFDYKEKKCFLGDPFPNENVKKFANQIGAKIIDRFLNDLIIKDFQ